MTARRLSRFLVLALALCFVLATTPGLRFLCVGSDGQVSIEMAFDGCCASPDPAASGDLASSCEGCEDLPLEMPSVVAKERSDLDALMEVCWGAMGADRPAERRSDVPAGMESERPAEPRGPSLTRSVVLRC